MKKFNYQVTDWMEEGEIEEFEEFFNKYDVEYKIKKQGSFCAIFSDYVPTRTKDLIRGVKTGVNYE
jgi:hypothetical protein